MSTPATALSLLLLQLALAVLLLLCQGPTLATANLSLPLSAATPGTSISLTTYDIDWRYRQRRFFTLSDSLLRSDVSFDATCTPLLSSPLNPTDTIHVHLSHTLCFGMGAVANALTQTYYNGSEFAVLLITLDLEEAAGGEWSTTPWGDPLALQMAPFQIAMGPYSTAAYLWNYTANYTIQPIVNVTSDAGPWNDFNNGPAATVYYSILSVIYICFFGYASYLHYTFFRERGGFRCDFQIRTIMFSSAQCYAIFQLLFMWLPSYPYVLSNTFFWFSYLFNYIAYTLLLLVWVSLVRREKNSVTVISVGASKGMHIFSYVAMVVVLCIMLSAVIATPYPHIAILALIRYAFYCFLPIVLMSQAVTFLYYGIRVIRLLGTFNMTEEKKALMRRMTILMASSAVAYAGGIMMSILVLALPITVPTAWLTITLRDASSVINFVFIFVSLSEKSARKTSSQGNSSSNNQGPRKQSAFMSNRSASNLVKATAPEMNRSSASLSQSARMDLNAMLVLGREESAARLDSTDAASTVSQSAQFSHMVEIETDTDKEVAHPNLELKVVAMS